MSDDADPERTEYIIGPFSLLLMPGWSGSFEDGVHTLESEDTETAIQISGFEWDKPVELSDLYALVPEDAEDVTRFSLVSGLDGFGWTDPESRDGYRMIRSGAIVLAIRVLIGDDGPDDDSEVIGDMLGSLAQS